MRDGLDDRVTIPLDGPPSVRVEVDLLATALTTLVEFYGPLQHRSSPQVAAEVRRLGKGLPLPTLLRLLTDPVRTGVPDFFWLSPSHGDLTFEQRVEQLRSTTAERVVDDLTQYGQVPGARLDPYRHWVDRPDRALSDICDILRRYWVEVVCQIYAQPARRIIDQARRLEDLAARHGPSVAMTSTNSNLYVGENFASMTFNYPESIWARPKRPRRALILKPMICAPLTTINNFLYDDEPMLWIAASTESLSSWRPGLPAGDVDVPLSGLLGVRRTRLIRALTRRSATTTELAAELGIAASTVSYHLGALTSAGVLDSMRTGSSVYYHLTDRGYRLLQI